jgi:hypothetical protein
MMRDLLHRYGIHLVGLLVLGALLHYWHAGELTDGSFVILGITAAVELGIWAFFRKQFAAYEDDPEVGRLRDLREKVWKASGKKSGRPA